jgi:hypothetical protein
MSGVSLYDELKLFPVGDGPISAEEMTELDKLGFRRDDIDQTTVYHFHDLEPYQDLAAGRSGVIAIRKAWREVAVLEEVPLIWSSDGSKYLVDLCYDDSRTLLDRIFEDTLIPVSPRVTRIASAMLEFFGTNVGLSLLQEAEKYYTEVEPKLSRPSAYELYWHELRGLRSEKTHLVTVFLNTTREVKFTDSEVMSLIMRWLGSENGQALIEKARKYRVEIEQQPGVL